MRMDDYQKWLDAQFLDESSEYVTDETELQSPITEAEEPVAAVPEEQSAISTEPTPSMSEFAAPRPVHVEPRPISQPAEIEPKAEESALPALDDYLPFLRARMSETAEPAPPLAETPQASLGPESPASTEPGNFEPEKLTYTPMVAGTAIEERQAKPASTAPATPRARHARPAAQAESAQPLDPEKLWNLVPKHLQVLIATDSDEVAQNSYKRQFKESRIDLISRLLDPTLSLEDTARVLNVCPTTVRRYTNKGLLTHQRTQGDQRRFKLSDVLAFLEAQSRKDS